MRKTFLFLVLPIMFWCCGGNDEPNVDETQKQADEISAILNGHFVASHEISYMDGATEFKEITFAPYSSPTIEEWSSIDSFGNYSSKNVKFYGECNFTTYYILANNPDEKLLEVTENWRYNIDVAYAGAQPRLCLYPNGVYGKSEMHDLTIVDEFSFKMDDLMYQKR